MRTKTSIVWRRPRSRYPHPYANLAAFPLAASPLVADDKSALLQKMDARAAHYGDVSRKIWEFAEVGYKENKSAELLKSELRSAGFTLADNVAGIPTAFTATWGQGKPVIAIMGEYDALPGLSQEDVPDRKPRRQRRSRTWLRP